MKKISEVLCDPEPKGLSQKLDPKGNGTFHPIFQLFRRVSSFHNPKGPSTYHPVCTLIEPSGLSRNRVGLLFYIRTQHQRQGF